MITNSEKYKMKDSTGRDTITMWFNTELFNINGEPLKFYLEGYDEIEFCNLVKIIEAYGGKLSEPTEDTIIFSEPDHPAGIHQRYNLKYLRDSILVNELLELEQYELPLAANHHHWDVENCGDVLDKEETLEKKFTTSTKVKRERANNVDDRASIISRDSSSGEDASGAARTRPSIFLRKRKINDEKAVEEEAEKKKLCKRDTSPHKESVLHDEDSINLKKKVKEASLDNQSSPNEPVEDEKRSGDLFTTDEKRQMLQYLVDKNAISRGKSLGIWKEMIADFKITHRSADGLRNQFRGSLRRTYKRYTEDVDVREKLEQVYSNKGCQRAFTKEENHEIIKFLIDNNAISRVTDIEVWEEMIANNKIIDQSARNLRNYFLLGLRHNYRQYTNDIHALEEFEKINNEIASDHTLYTAEEERKMIQYLIDKKSIFRARGRIIWAEMAVDKLTDRSAASLQGHFLNKLRYQYKQYTQDAEACKEFEKLIKPGYSAKIRRWTKEESQIIIDYLIENDVIHRANGETVWHEMSKKPGILDHRSGQSMYGHFQRILRYKYRQYTSDPEALAKFAAIEPKKKVVK